MYDSPHQFEPLLPAVTQQEPLLAKAHDLARAATQLAGQSVAAELRALLRGMNSYYTNRIEGEHTRPHEIEQALRKDFSRDSNLAARQRLAVAHIEAEAAIEARYAGEAGARRLYSIDAVQDLHRELFARLPADDLFTSEGEPIVPGQLRQRDVRVGEHIAPTHGSLAAFLSRWAAFYGDVRRGEATLVALAAAHQRLGWIHPFIEGNGRVMRLHTHALLAALGYSNGLWSPLRGFARSTERYCALLAAADLPRRDDLDGRGNLGEQALAAWIDYMLDVCLDYLFLTGGELERGEFKSMTGLGDRTAVSALSALVKRGLLKSDTPQGKVRFALPLHALRFYFPALWPEAEADAQGR